MATEILLGICCILIIIAAIPLTLLSSTPAKDKMLAPFLNFFYAHRGLHTKDKSIPENSLPAFVRAVEHGYGIELDLQLSKDGEVIVFHDDTLERVCGIEGRPCDYTAAELQTFSLFQTQYTIPSFHEVLSAVNGRVPLIVELKKCDHYPELCKKAYTMLQNYSGAYCIESFDPKIVRWFRKHAKKVVRGQLSADFSTSKEGNRFQHFVLTNLLTNWYTRPHFISYDHHSRDNFAFRICCRLFHLLPVAWTVRDTDDLEEIRKTFRLIIFEYFEPEGKERP